MVLMKEYTKEHEKEDTELAECIKRALQDGYSAEIAVAWCRYMHSS